MWSGDDWKLFLKAHGVRLADAVRQAQALVAEINDRQPELNVPVPTAAAGLSNYHFASLLLEWVLDQDEAA